MTKAYRHTGVLLMVAVIGLAVVGLGYALWFQVLSLNASVTTGNLDVEWSNHGVQKIYSVNQGDTYIHDTIPNAAGTPIANPGFIPAKAVQTCAQDITDSGHTMVITDTGLYPYAGCAHRIDIHNNGTVPVHVDLSQLALKFTCSPQPCDALAELNVLFNLQSCVLGNTGQNAPPNFVGDSRTIVQLHPSNVVICDLIVTANQAAHENTTYTGTVKVLACQWNEQSACSFANTGGRSNNETPLPTNTPTAVPTNTPTAVPTNTPAPTATPTP